MEEQINRQPEAAEPNEQEARHEAEREPAKNIFRQESLDRISSPEQLNDYIKVANPSVWVIIAAAILLLAGLLAWSALGTVETTVRDTFYVQDEVAYGYLADASDVAAGMEARFGEHVGTVSAVSAQPRSSREIEARYSDDYVVHMLGVGDWDYEIAVSVPGMEDGLAEGTIVTGNTRPVTFIFN